MTPIDYQVGDRLLVSSMDEETNLFSDKVFEIVITEFSPSKIYVKAIAFQAEFWFATDKLKVREKLEPKVSWFTAGTV